MFNYDSNVMLSTDSIEIPPVPISAKIAPLNTVQELFISPQSNILDWAEFHLGTSVGLEIREDCKGIDSSWIVFNQTKGRDGKPELNAKHAGFIFGLGLCGHLSYLENQDTMRFYLTPQDDMISVGLLLGLGVSFLGTKNARM